MSRYVAEISYDGGMFCGWQLQAGLPTVQGALEDALSFLNGSPVAVEGAGRTDSGVHARGQVCSFDLDRQLEPGRLISAINAHLPKGVSIMRLVKAPREDFHARFDAGSREYIYFVWNASVIYPALEPYVCWLKSGVYDWQRAKQACACLEGKHNFGAFCRLVNRPDNPVRTIYRARLSKKGRLIRLHLTGSGFLTNMVRVIMGNLELVARGAKEPEWMKTLLTETGERCDGGRTFPPSGLFLWKINYKPSPWNSH